LQRTLSLNNVSFTIPSKTTTLVDEENRTSKTIYIPFPTTTIRKIVITDKILLMDKLFLVKFHY